VRGRRCEEYLQCGGDRGARVVGVLGDRLGDGIDETIDLAQDERLY
jgi:hypothetical protein